jgi:hypothetical protein
LVTPQPFGLECRLETLRLFGQDFARNQAL